METDLVHEDFGTCVETGGDGVIKCVLETFLLADDGV